MALLRAIGARHAGARRQLVEALIVGLLASFAGLLLGFLVAGLLKGLLAVPGVDLAGGGDPSADRDRGPSRRYARHGRAGRVPALRASRVPPLAALRATSPSTERARGGSASSSASRRRWLASPGLVVGPTAGVILWVGVGALLTFLGVFILVRSLARPAGLVGAPLPAVSGIAGELAARNAT